MRILKVASLFLFAFFYSISCCGFNGEIDSSSQIDSLKLLIANSTSSIKKAKHLAALANIYAGQGQSNSQIVCYKKILNLIDNHVAPDLYAMSTIRLGQLYRGSTIFKPDSAYIYINNVSTVLEQISPALRLESLEALTGVHYTIYRFEEATRYCLDCIDLAKELDNKKSLRFCYARMSTYSRMYLNDEEQVKKYSKKALELSLEEGDTREIAYYYLLHSSKLNYLEEYDNALIQLDSCEKYIHISGREDLIVDMLMTRALANMHLGDHELAEQNYKKALVIAKEQGVWNRQMHIPLDLAHLYLNQQKYNKAITHSHKAISIFPDKLTLFELEKANRQLHEGYREIGDYKKALYHFELWKVYKDSMNQLNNISVIAGIEGKYKNEQQKKQIGFQNEIIQKQINMRNIIMSFLLLLALFSLGIFYFFLKVRKSNVAIEHQNQVIKKQAEKLKQLDKFKSRFFANVSHELRTPLTLMLGPISSALKSNQLDNRNFTFLKMAQQSGIDVLKLLNSILDLSKMEAGKIELKETVQPLYQLTRRIVSNFESHAQREGVRFGFNYNAEKDLQIEIDKDKFETILNNLFSNAIKFTQSGGRVSVDIQDIKNTILIAVSDTGRGIHTDDIPFLFDRFYQSNQSDAPTEGGTGIGLALSHELVELMGGKIWVESTLGKGSTFYITIPRKEVIKMAEPFEEEVQEQFILIDTKPEPKGTTVNENDFKKILIVEDNYSLRNYLQTILSPYYTILMAENGLVALDLLQENGDCQLILSDIMMPEMDGYQLLKVLKSRDYYHHIPVIMLTALADSRDKLKALRIGVDDYLLKPFNEEELLVRIENLIKNYQGIRVNKPEHKGEKQRPTISEEDKIWLEEFELYIKNNLSKVDLSVAKLSQEFGKSESTLLRLLKRLTGLTPSKYLQEHRLDLARQMFELKTYNTISQVAYEVGFKDAKSFARSFKKRFGKSPSDYSNL